MASWRITVYTLRKHLDAVLVCFLAHNWKIYHSTNKHYIVNLKKRLMNTVRFIHIQQVFKV